MSGHRFAIRYTKAAIGGRRPEPNGIPAPGAALRSHPCVAVASGQVGPAYQLRHASILHVLYGSEYINHDVARLLGKLLIEQTKSRSRHSNDNGLVEANNGRGDPQALGLWLHLGAARRSDHGVL
jgi:transposase InsO family protein